MCCRDQINPGNSAIDKTGRKINRLAFIVDNAYKKPAENVKKKR
jgi:hypothetical protein